MVEKQLKGFTDFKSGKHITNKEINEWIEEARDGIKKGAEYSCISSGNTMVILLNNGDDIEVIVAKDYKLKFMEK